MFRLCGNVIRVSSRFLETTLIVLRYQGIAVHQRSSKIQCRSILNKQLANFSLTVCMYIHIYLHANDLNCYDSRREARREIRSRSAFTDRTSGEVHERNRGSTSRAGTGAIDQTHGHMDVHNNAVVKTKSVRGNGDVC